MWSESALVEIMHRYELLELQNYL